MVYFFVFLFNILLKLLKGHTNKIKTHISPLGSTEGGGVILLVTENIYSNYFNLTILMLKFTRFFWC